MKRHITPKEASSEVPVEISAAAYRAGIVPDGREYEYETLREYMNAKNIYNRNPTSQNYDYMCITHAEYLAARASR